jgi:hypothetical protein
LLVLTTENEQNSPPSCVGMPVGANVGGDGEGRGVSGAAVGFDKDEREGSGVGLLTFVRPPTTSSAPLQVEPASHPIATL